MGMDVNDVYEYFWLCRWPLLGLVYTFAAAFFYSGITGVFTHGKSMKNWQGIINSSITLFNTETYDCRYLSPSRHPIRKTGPITQLCQSAQGA